MTSIHPWVMTSPMYTYRYIDGDFPFGDVFLLSLLSSLSVNGSLDIVTAAGGQLRGLVLELDEIELDDAFTLRLLSIRGRTLISGIELIASGLDRARVPVVDTN